MARRQRRPRDVSGFLEIQKQLSEYRRFCALLAQRSIMMRAMFPTRLRALVSLALISFAAVALVACGNSKTASTTTSETTASTVNAGGTSTQTSTVDTSPGEVIAQVGATQITKAQVNHWINTLAGVDYFTIAHQPLPEGLFSDPPDYASCVSRLETAAASSPSGGAGQTAVQLLAKCRELDLALRLQATTFLVNAQVNFAIAHEAGINITNAAIKQLFDHTKAKEYPTEADLRQYLANRHTTVPDIELETKLELLGNIIFAKATTPHGRALITTGLRRWTAKTSCKKGYVVEHCKQYGSEATAGASTSAAILMEQLSGIIE